MPGEPAEAGQGPPACQEAAAVRTLLSESPCRPTLSHPPPPAVAGLSAQENAAPGCPTASSAPRLW